MKEGKSGKSCKALQLHHQQNKAMAGCRAASLFFPQLYLGTALGKKGIKAFLAVPPCSSHPQGQKKKFCLHHPCFSRVIFGSNEVLLGAWYDIASYQKEETLLLCVPGEISMYVGKDGKCESLCQVQGGCSGNLFKRWEHFPYRQTGGTCYITATSPQ